MEELKELEDLQTLVIDDEPEVLEVMVDILEQAGYPAQSTSDSENASRLLETSKFDLIVSDIMMPHLSGLQLLEIAKRQNPDVQVVLVTGYANRQVALEALEKGASGFIEKPIEIEPFLAAVRQALWRRRLKQNATSSGQRGLA
ncbi:MAG: response regulator [Candidatus Methylomirabilia bacterium]